jgi:RHS repeat-associated protein
LTYTYDAAGNRFTVNRVNGTASLLPNAVALASYDAANEQTSFAGANLTYDANGNLTNDGTNAYVWDARNRLVGMNGGTSASFAYDPLGRRVSKTINGISSQFVYDGIDVTAEIESGAVGANYLRSLSMDQPFIRQVGVEKEHYHVDALGSSLVLSNTTGGPVAEYGYEPFGKTTASGSSSNVFQYTARENDGTGLYHYRARYYSPSSSRFLGSDLFNHVRLQLERQASSGDTAAQYLDVFMRNPSLWHPYSYTSNSPVNRIDPLGLLYVDVGGNLPLVWPGEFGPVVNGGIQIDDNGSVFFYGGWGLGVGPSASIVFFPGNPDPGIATKISGSYQLLPAIPTPLGMIPPLGIKGAMTFDPQGAASVKVGGGINIGSSLAFIPQNISMCVLRCSAGKVKSKTNQ